MRAPLTSSRDERPEGRGDEAGCEIQGNQEVGATSTQERAGSAGSAAVGVSPGRSACRQVAVSVQGLRLEVHAAGQRISREARRASDGLRTYVQTVP